MQHRWRHALAAALCLLLALQLGGCYSRIELQPKTTPPASKIALDIRTSSDLLSWVDQVVAAAGENEVLAPEQVAQQAAFTRNALTQMAPNLMNQLKSDLLRMNLGFPVVDPEAEADLKLSGVFRSTPYNGLALDWELIEVRSGAIVKAGTVDRLIVDGNVEPFADGILTDLLNTNIDAYASATGDRPTAATPPAASVDQPTPAATDGSRSWAIIIGIERYREALPAVTGAENDARVFAEYVKATFGVPEAHIKMLLGDRASRADIASAIEEWLPRNAIEKGGRVYIFFSGHGAPDVESGDAYLVPWDADPAYIRTRGYPVSVVYDKLNGLKDQQSIVFIDSCFSGVGDRTVLAAGTRPLVPVKDAAPKGGVVAFTASSASQATGAHPDGRHGLFTHHLLDALRGSADANTDRNISLGELVAFVKERVERDARLQNREQSPVLKTPSGLDPNRFELVQGLR